MGMECSLILLVIRLEKKIEKRDIMRKQDWWTDISPGQPSAI